MADTIHAVFLLKCLKQVIPIMLEKLTFPDWTSFPFIFSSYLFHTVGHLVLILATASLNKIYHFHHNTTKNGKKKRWKRRSSEHFFVVWTHRVHAKRWFNITIRVLTDLNFSAFSESFSCCALIGFLSMLYKISTQFHLLQSKYVTKFIHSLPKLPNTSLMKLEQSWFSGWFVFRIYRREN